MSIKTTISAFGLGALAVYAFDPDGGTRRRKLLNDAGLRAGRDVGRFLDAARRDLRNRAVGAVAEARYRVRGGTDIPDDQLVRRVAAKVGRCVSHPRALEIVAENGRVTFSGRILADEVESLLATIQMVPGVKGVVNKLEIHQEAGNVPDLQGGRPRGRRLDRELRSPGLRLLQILGGALLAGDGLRRGGLTGAVLGVTGIALAGKAAANGRALTLLGIGEGGEGLAFHKSLTIQAPLERVYDFFDGFVNFPHFMRNVREVRDLGDGRSDWVVAGPAGAQVRWRAVMTQHDPGRVIAWESEAGSQVANAGHMLFEPLDANRTRVLVDLSYRPPVGVIGHAVASLFGKDPKHEMDADFARAKQFLETGRAARDAAMARFDRQGH